MNKNTTKIAQKYAKIVEWSDEDNCYIGRIPALSYGGVHGKDAKKVFAEICRVAEEIVAIHIADGRTLPSASPKKYSGRFMLRIPPSLHEAIALQAEGIGASINSVATQVLRNGLVPVV